ncbi:MAG: hypothetical protein COY39_01445 [Alphaproteobacteria bacterium CG_4_10_14_0_8_um_filter_37_21]|nr:MAG: hypothetical protein COY39_01445 [Alphaproteobacteria bacterium CG_4_10_14_0_8_um_filter_37_21]
MKIYYIVATVLFYGIVTQTEAGVMATQPMQLSLAKSLPNIPGAKTDGATQSPDVQPSQFSGMPAPMTGGMSVTQAPAAQPSQLSGMPAPMSGGMFVTQAPAAQPSQLSGMPAPMPGAMPVTPPAMQGSIQPSSNTALEDFLPSIIVKGVIAHASLEEAQKALDDSSAFVLNDGQRVGCFGAINSVPRTGFVRPAANGQPAQCMTFDPNTGKITPVSIFKVPLSNVPFEWRAGSAINPDEWVTGTKGIPTADYANPVTGVCAQKDPQSNNPILLGAAVRRQGAQHVCVLPNGMYPLNHLQVLVLAK